MCVVRNRVINDKNSAFVNNSNNSMSRNGIRNQENKKKCAEVQMEIEKAMWVLINLETEMQVELEIGTFSELSKIFLLITALELLPWSLT